VPVAAGVTGRGVGRYTRRMRCMLLLLLAVSLPLPATELHRGLGPAPDTLDIHQAQGLSSFNLLRDLHEGLLTRDARGRPVAAIAETWQVTDDRLRWTFRLAPDARWSDGQPIVAADFVRGFQRALDPATAAPTRAWLEPIRSLDAPAPDRLIIELERAVPWFEELLTLPLMFPWRDDRSDLFSGAFVLARRVPGARFELERNRRFRDAAQVRAERVIWHVTEDPSAELARFRAGELHITETVPPGRIDWLRDELGPALRIAPYLGSFYLVFNLDREPFADAPALREALVLAVDRDILVERVLGSGELPAWGLVPPGMPGWSAAPPPAAGRQEQLERARRLYRQAGFSRRRPAGIELRYNSSLTQRRLAVAVAAMWKQQLGVRTRLVNEEWKVFVTNRRQGRITELVRGGWIADWSDPVNFLGNFHSASALNYSFFDDAEFDALLERAATGHGAERIDTLARAERRLLEANAIVPLYYYVSRHLVDPRVTGFEDNAMDIHLSRWLDLAP